MIKNVIIIFLYIFLTNQINAQIISINKDSALKIAINCALRTDLEHEIILQDSVWQIKNILCGNLILQRNNIIKVNANTGKIIPEDNDIEILDDYFFKFHFEDTHLKINYNLDTLPVINKSIIRKLMPVGITNPVFSLNDKFIAFSYSNEKIGVENIDGSAFKTICISCFSPQWISNDCIAYQSKNGNIFKTNIITNIVTPLTNTAPFPLFGFKISPDNKWIAYTSDHDYSNGKKIMQPYEGEQWTTLSLQSIDGKIKKFINNYGDKVWNHYNYIFWTPNSDTLLFYISNEKYYATGLKKDMINSYKYTLLPNLSFWDYDKIINNVFPYHSNSCQILEVDKNKMLPTKILVNESDRYGYLRLAHNLKYLIFSKADSSGHDIFWIKEIE